MTRTCVLLFLFWFCGPLAGPARCQETRQPAERAVWKLMRHDSAASLRGLHVVDNQVIWTSGSGGTVLRSIDGGQTWERVSPTGGDNLDFRDIHAFDAERAVVVSAGAPARVYVTADGGRCWQRVHEDRREPVFFDAMDFDANGNGVLFSDPVNGRLLLVVSNDGGRSWQELERPRQPETLPAEAGFAASGSCLCQQDGRWIIGLGGGSADDPPRPARLLMTDDRGGHWTAVDTPLPAGPASGIFSVAFANRDHGVLVGGTYTEPDNPRGNAAWTSDGGNHWYVPQTPPAGYRSGVAVRPTPDGFQMVCVGPGGSDLSVDGGQTWQPLDDTGFHAVDFSDEGTLGVASGADGRIGVWRQADSPQPGR